MPYTDLDMLLFRVEENGTMQTLVHYFSLNANIITYMYHERVVLHVTLTYTEPKF